MAPRRPLEPAQRLGLRQVLGATALPGQADLTRKTYRKVLALDRLACVRRMTEWQSP